MIYLQSEHSINPIVLLYWTKLEPLWIVDIPLGALTSSQPLVVPSTPQSANMIVIAMLLKF